MFFSPMKNAMGLASRRSRATKGFDFAQPDNKRDLGCVIFEVKRKTEK
jgi:hypothetical protein